MELIRKSDALHAVLHNQGDAAVAAIQGLKAFSPQGGVWQGIIIDGQYWAITCSNCHQVGFNAKTPYCPNSGARMRTVTDCHTLEEGEQHGET